MTHPTRNCWLVMQYQQAPDSEESVYTVQGIFDSQDKAIAVCKSNQYVIFPMTINEVLPDEWYENNEAFFPLAEN
jgi:hypothetical protein